MHLQHHGILGQKWGKKMGPPYPLEKHSAKEIARMDKKDTKWATKHYNKIYDSVYKKSEKELLKYMDNELASKYAEQLANGNVGRTYINELNSQMASVMTRNASAYSAPSGRAVKFVAKRGGEVGVYMALADINDDMSSVKNGVWGSGKIAYKNQNVNMVEGK